MKFVVFIALDGCHSDVEERFYSSVSNYVIAFLYMIM